MPNKNDIKCQQLASLYVLNALNSTEKDKFEERLKNDAELREFVQKCKSTLDSVKSAANYEVSDEYLQAQRNLLRGRIDLLNRERKATPIWSTVKEKSDNVLNLLIFGKQPGWAIATYIVLAIFAGRLVFAPSSDNNVAMNNQPNINELIEAGGLSNVAINVSDNFDSPIQFVSLGDNNLNFAGGLQDKKIRQMLYYLLLNDENPGNRLKAVRLLENVQPDEESKLVLISSLLSEPNSGVRLNSIKLLEKYRLDDRIINACQKVMLEDTNEAIRIEALKILSKEPTVDLIPLLQLVSNMDDNEFIRDESRKLLSSLKNPVSIENIEVY